MLQRSSEGRLRFSNDALKGLVGILYAWIVIGLFVLWFMFETDDYDHMIPVRYESIGANR